MPVWIAIELPSNCHWTAINMFGTRRGSHTAAEEMLTDPLTLRAIESMNNVPERKLGAAEGFHSIALRPPSPDRSVSPASRYAPPPYMPPLPPATSLIGVRSQMAPHQTPSAPSLPEVPSSLGLTTACATLPPSATSTASIARGLTRGPPAPRPATRRAWYPHRRSLGR